MQDIGVVRMKFLLLVSSLICLGLLLAAAYQENFTTEWRADQTAYAELLAEQAKTSGKPARAYAIAVRQAYLADWGRIDRCVTCHVAIDNPSFQGQPQPLATHPGNMLKHHSADRYGCTICHQGQGRATEKDAAHGRIPYWTEPLLTGDFVQASCPQCHHEEVVPEAPVLNHGRKRLVELGCGGCHQTGNVTSAAKVGPRLAGIGSKVSYKWLTKWLANPKDYLPAGAMPQFHLGPQSVRDLAAYLMTFKDPTIDAMPDQEGDYDAGDGLRREAQCVVCHITAERLGQPIGGTIGPDLRKIGNKVNSRWLQAFLKNPHTFAPNTKMPKFNLTAKQALDVSQFAIEEWVDYDLLDAEEAEPAIPPATPEEIETGKRLYHELGCNGCHDLAEATTAATANGPDLTYIGSRPVHQLTFGDAKIRHTMPDFLYTKLKAPRSLHHAFRLPTEESPSEALWRSLRPAALFADSHKLPSTPEPERLAWILQQTQQAGLLDAKLTMPTGSVHTLAEWLVAQLEATNSLNPLKMPDFDLSDEDAEALTIALMSLSEVSAPSKRFEVLQEPKAIFNPNDEFGRLVRRYRCTSCHKFRDSGNLLASDLTWEGSRANHEWLFHYLNKPYSMRRTLTIAMPSFHFPEQESHLMADYISQVFVDVDIGDGWERGREKSDAQRGEKLFADKGCIACHQLHGKGGDVGPSLTTQVPEFPQGTWVGDKLRPGWIYQWLKNPQALLPDAIEPNLGLAEQDVLDLTAFLAGVKNPEFQEQNK